MKQILNNYVVRSFALLCLLSFTLLLGADEGRIFNARLISNTKVNCIVQDKKGFIWLGTNYGVNRYDGYNFVTYRYNNKTRPVLLTTKSLLSSTTKKDVCGLDRPMG